MNKFPEGFDKEEKMKFLKDNPLSSDLIDKIITTKDLQIIRELLFYQDLQTHQFLEILKLGDYELNNELYELHRDEYDLPMDLIDRIWNEEDLTCLKDDLIWNYPLTQEKIMDYLKSCSDKGKIEDLIEFQSLNDDAVLYTFNNHITLVPDESDLYFGESYPETKDRVLRLLIQNHRLSDEIIQTLIMKNLHIMDIVRSQKLSDKWVLFFLKDDEWKDLHYELCIQQTFSQSVLDFIFKGENSLLYSVVRLQKLDLSDIIKSFETESESIILGLLETQRITDEEIKVLKEKFPQYTAEIEDRTLDDDYFWSCYNRRLRRDGRLEQEQKWIKWIG